MEAVKSEENPCKCHLWLTSWRTRISLRTSRSSIRIKHFLCKSTAHKVVTVPMVDPHLVTTAIRESRKVNYFMRSVGFAEANLCILSPRRERNSQPWYQPLATKPFGYEEQRIPQKCGYTWLNWPKGNLYWKEEQFEINSGHSVVPIYIFKIRHFVKDGIAASPAIINSRTLSRCSKPTTTMSRSQRFEIGIA